MESSGASGRHRNVSTSDKSAATRLHMSRTLRTSLPTLRRMCCPNQDSQCRAHRSGAAVTVQLPSSGHPTTTLQTRTHLTCWKGKRSFACARDSRKRAGRNSRHTRLPLLLSLFSAPFFSAFLSILFGGLTTRAPREKKFARVNAFEGVDIEINGSPPTLRRSTRIAILSMPMKRRMNRTTCATSIIVVDDVLEMASVEFGARQNRRIAWLFILLSQVLDCFCCIQVIFPSGHQ